MCKYWSLKRESRRGASLLKRLQLALEGESARKYTRDQAERRLQVILLALVADFSLLLIFVTILSGYEC